MKCITSVALVFLLGFQYYVVAQSDSFHERSSVLLIFHRQYEGCGDCDHLTKVERNTRVFENLLELKFQTQYPVLLFLDSLNIQYRSYYVANFIQLLDSTDTSVLEEVEERFGHILSISLNAGLKLPELKDDSNLDVNYSFRGEATWNLIQTGATSVWEMGYKGAGVVIGGQDTGYDWLHPDLYYSYRGVTNSSGEILHDYHWYDAIKYIDPLHGDSVIVPELNPCGLGIDFPCDDHRHGTHTMGIITGGNHGGTAIGVAPEAVWIGCRNMERGYGHIASYLRCFQWFLAPTRTDGTDPSPGKAPHIVNNSWTCPEIEGCNSSNYQLIGQAIFNLREAGIFVVASAGNDGNHCGSLNNPPAIFKSSFVVGSTDEDRSVSSFSSFGPVEINGNNYLKPDVAAPGRNIRSANLNGGYRNSSGTSMAGPHVVGLAALILSAKPDLAGKTDRIEEIITSTTEIMFYDGQCEEFLGMDSPNFAYGHGIVNMLDAVKMALGGINSESNVAVEHGFKVFPNPSFGQFKVECPLCDNDSHFTVLDLVGNPLTTGRLVANKVNVDHLKAGYYFLRISANENRTYTHPIIIIK